MRRFLSLVAATLLIAGIAVPTLAAPCKDAKGKFIKCPPAKAVPCKDARGKFVKCTAPGAKPIK